MGPDAWRKFIIAFVVFLVVTLIIKLVIVITRFHLFGF